MRKELRKENINMEEIVAALLTIAWASTKGREISQTEAYNVYKNMIEKIMEEENKTFSKDWEKSFSRMDDIFKK